MRLLSNSQNLQILFYLVLFIQWSMSRDPPNMIAYTSWRPLLRPWLEHISMSRQCTHF